jgi:hypothetical protein
VLVLVRRGPQLAEKIPFFASDDELFDVEEAKSALDEPHLAGLIQETSEGERATDLGDRN